MGKQFLFAVFAFCFLLNFAFSIPIATYNFDANSYRPGTAGKLFVEINNNEGNDERNFYVCITPSETRTQLSVECKSIDYIKSGENGSTAILFWISNDAASPSSIPVEVYFSYQYNTAIGWFPDIKTVQKSINVNGISIKEEAKQKLGELDILISTTESTLMDARVALNSAEATVSDADSIQADTHIATIHLINSKNMVSSAETNLNEAKNQKYKAQEEYNANRYFESLSLQSTALGNAATAKAQVRVAFEEAQKAETVARTAKAQAQTAIEEAHKVETAPRITIVNTPQESALQNQQNTNLGGIASRGSCTNTARQNFYLDENCIEYCPLKASMCPPNKNYNSKTCTCDTPTESTGNTGFFSGNGFSVAVVIISIAVVGFILLGFGAAMWFFKKKP